MRRELVEAVRKQEVLHWALDWRVTLSGGRQSRQHTECWKSGQLSGVTRWARVDGQWELEVLIATDGDAVVMESPIEGDRRLAGRSAYRQIEHAWSAARVELSETLGVKLPTCEYVELLGMHLYGERGGSQLDLGVDIGASSEAKNPIAGWLGPRYWSKLDAVAKDGKSPVVHIRAPYFKGVLSSKDGGPISWEGWNADGVVWAAAKKSKPRWSIDEWRRRCKEATSRKGELPEPNVEAELAALDALLEDLLGAVPDGHSSPRFKHQALVGMLPLYRLRVVPNELPGGATREDLERYVTLHGLRLGAVFSQRARAAGWPAAQSFHFGLLAHQLWLDLKEKASPK